LKNKMIIITIILFVGFAISLPIYVLTDNGVLEDFTISLGVAFYHFAMRLAVGTIVDLIMKNKANYKNFWFREKKFENKFYKFLRVQKWKKYLPTYSPETFDTNKKNVKEIIGATCQAEIVHEIVMPLSLLPMILIPFLGGAAAFIITSIISMLLDFSFVILQRYNRPKLIKVMDRFEKIK